MSIRAVRALATELSDERKEAPSLPPDEARKRYWEAVEERDRAIKSLLDTGLVDASEALSDARVIAAEAKMRAAMDSLRQPQKYDAASAKSSILSMFDAMAKAADEGGQFVSSLDPPPANGWDPSKPQLRSVKKGGA